MKSRAHIEAKLEQRQRWLEVLADHDKEGADRVWGQIEALEWVLYPPEKDDDFLVEFKKNADNYAIESEQ